jgi:hypothetical protein
MIVSEKSQNTIKTLIDKIKAEQNIKIFVVAKVAPEEKAAVKPVKNDVKAAPAK